MRCSVFVLAFAGVVFVPVTVVGQEPPVVVVGEPEAQPATGPILIVVELATPAAATGEPATAEPAEVDADLELDEEPEEAAFAPGPVLLGLSGLVGTRSDTAGGLAPTWTAGVDLGLRLGDHFAIGVRRVTATATARGRDQWALGVSPCVELAGRVWERVELFAQLGAALEIRAGQSSGLGVAPFTGGGARFFVADIFSIAVEAAVHVPVTDTFLLGHEVFPFGAVVVQGGLALAFHVG